MNYIFVTSNTIAFESYAIRLLARQLQFLFDINVIFFSVYVRKINICLEVYKLWCCFGKMLIYRVFSIMSCPVHISRYLGFRRKPSVIDWVSYMLVDLLRGRWFRYILQCGTPQGGKLSPLTSQQNLILPNNG